MIPKLWKPLKKNKNCVKARANSQIQATAALEIPASAFIEKHRYLTQQSGCICFAI